MSDFGRWPDPSPVLLPAGWLGWHVHDWDPATGNYPSTSYNPFAAGRYSGMHADRAMMYIGETAAVALWETLLRDATPDARNIVWLFRDELAGKRLCRLAATEDLHVLPLFAEELRRQAGATLANEWMQLNVTDRHPYTHGPTASLLKHLARRHPDLRVDGMMWESKQCGNALRHPKAYVFYDPPSRAECFTDDLGQAVMLDSDRGLAYLKRTIEAIGLRLAVHDGADDAELGR